MKKKIGKYTIKIKQDTNADCPGDWGNDDHFLVYDHRDFCVQRKGFVPLEIFQATINKKTFDGYWVFPVYAYIHGGVSLSVGSHNFPDARWDVSMKGFALIKREAGTYTEKVALKVAKSLIEDWNQYLSGDVYGYRIIEKTVDENGKKHKEEIDSCWGFYGKEYCMTEAESIVNHLIEKETVKEKI